MKIKIKILLIVLFLTNISLEFPLSEIEFPCAKKISHLVDNIYLGDIRAAISEKTLEQYNIKYVINVGSGKHNFSGIQYFELGIELKKDAKLFPSLEKGYDYIKAIQKNITEKINNLNKTLSGNLTSNMTGNISSNNTINESILVYCFDGKSRGPALLIFYLMKDKNISAIKAFKYVSSKRKGVLPMTEFAKQLYEKQSDLKIGKPTQKSKPQKEEKNPTKKDNKTTKKNEKGKVKPKPEKTVKSKQENIKKSNKKKEINKKIEKTKSNNNKLKDKEKKTDVAKKGKSKKEEQTNPKDHSKIDINNIKIKQTDSTQDKKQDKKKHKKEDL